MADEQNPSVDKLFDPTDSINFTDKTVTKLLDAAKVDAVYGKPVQYADTTIIPTAEVLSVAWVGAGAGGGRSSKDENIGGGSGAGGGGRVLSRPVAAIVITSGEVRVEPIVDVTKIGIAALTAAGFGLAMIARMSRRGRSPRRLA